MFSLRLLTKIAIADARGVCFEYAPRRIIRERNNWNTSYFPHHKFGTGSGRYSDDTQMSCAVAETLIDCGPDAPVRDFVEHFIDAFKREKVPREGYSGAFFQFLLSVADAEDFLARINPDSTKSGGAMRAGPCGVLSTIDEVMAVSARQAAITHDTTDGVSAAQAAALMVHYLFYQLGPRSHLPEFLNGHLPAYDWHHPHKGEVGARGIDSVRAAMTAVIRNDSLADLMIDCVNFGGDVDTVAAIAMAAAACARDVDQTIPQPLWEGLENGEYGRAYLLELDERFSTFAEAQKACRA